MTVCAIQTLLTIVKPTMILILILILIVFGLRHKSRHETCDCRHWGSSGWLVLGLAPPARLGCKAECCQSGWASHNLPLATELGWSLYCCRKKTTIQVLLKLERKQVFHFTPSNVLARSGDNFTRGCGHPCGPRATAGPSNNNCCWLAGCPVERDPGRAGLPGRYPDCAVTI